MKVAPYLLLMAAAPVTVGFGLLVMNSAAWVFLLFHGVICLLVPTVSILSRGDSPAETFRLFPCRHMTSTLVWSGILFSSVLGFFILFSSRLWNQGTMERMYALWELNSIPLPLLLLMMIVGNALLEEFFWRGFLVDRLSETLSSNSVILLTSVFYASYHGITTGILFSLKYAVMAVFAVFSAGVLWCAVRLRTNSLLFPVVTHFAVDAAIMTAYIIYLH